TRTGPWNQAASLEDTSSTPLRTAPHLPKPRHRPPDASRLARLPSDTQHTAALLPAPATRLQSLPVQFDFLESSPAGRAVPGTPVPHLYSISLHRRFGITGSLQLRCTHPQPI